jgi:hypothetical protein
MNGNRQNEAQSGSKSGDQELPGASYNPQPTTKAALTDPRSAKILPLTPPGLSVRFDQRFLSAPPLDIDCFRFVAGHTGISAMIEPHYEIGADYGVR